MTIRKARVRRAVALGLCLPAPTFQAYLEDIPSWHAPYIPFYAALALALAYQLFRIASPWSSKPQRFVAFDNERPFLEWLLLVGGMLCVYGGFSMITIDELLSLEQGNEMGFAVLQGPYSVAPSILVALTVSIAGVLFLVVRSGTVFDGATKTLWLLGLFPRRLAYESLRGLGIFETRWMRGAGYSHSSFQVALFIEGAKPKPVAGLDAVGSAADASSKIQEIHAHSGAPLAGSEDAAHFTTDERVRSQR